jgi:hypothetical protein
MSDDFDLQKLKAAWAAGHHTTSHSIHQFLRKITTLKNVYSSDTLLVCPAELYRLEREVTHSLDTIFYLGF